MRLSRALGFGGGTAAPGLVAAFFDPTVLARLAACLPQGSVIVTGTNGKTTTGRMLAGILTEAGLHPIHNRAGSNLIRGMTAALIARSDLAGQPHGDIGLWEVDEATLPLAVREVQPRVVVLNNLFRDQLDRYGEVDTVRRLWAEALRNPHPLASPAVQERGNMPTVILNADDPGVACLGRELDARVWYYGLEDPAMRLTRPVHAMDVRHCPFCHGRLVYELHFISHLGHYRCSNCGWGRPQPVFRASTIVFSQPSAVRCTIETPGGSFSGTLAVPGLYNVYNALAAVAAAMACGATLAQCREGLQQVRPAFGRGEWLDVEGRHVGLFLIKNPTGANEVLRMLTWTDPLPGPPPEGGGYGRGLNVLIAINDLTADGRDVSWLWDADFEMLAGRVAQVTVSGIRTQDMALRLKYAGLDPATFVVENDIEQALRGALHRLNPGETLHVLPTYTALLATQRVLARWGCRPSYWEE